FNAGATVVIIEWSSNATSKTVSGCGFPLLEREHPIAAAFKRELHRLDGAREQLIIFLSVLRISRHAYARRDGEVVPVIRENLIGDAGPDALGDKRSWSGVRLRQGDAKRLRCVARRKIHFARRAANHIGEHLKNRILRQGTIFVADAIEFVD